jgi:hypothetical protein
LLGKAQDHLINIHITMDHSPAEQLPNGRSVIKLVMGQANDAL